MKGLLYVKIVVVGALASLSYSINGFAWVNSGSTLGPFEGLHNGVTSEFRDANDSELEANIDRFVACGRDCSNRDEIFAERERIVRRMWPVIFDRLVVEADWNDVSIESLTDHGRFRLALNTHGAERLRNQCTPNIRYIWLGNTPQVEEVWDYSCPG